MVDGIFERPAVGLDGQIIRKMRSEKDRDGTGTGFRGIQMQRKPLCLSRIKPHADKLAHRLSSKGVTGFQHAEMQFVRTADRCLAIYFGCEHLQKFRPAFFLPILYAADWLSIIQCQRIRQLILGDFRLVVLISFVIAEFAGYPEFRNIQMTSVILRFGTVAPESELAAYPSARLADETVWHLDVFLAVKTVTEPGHHLVLRNARINLHHHPYRSTARFIRQGKQFFHLLHATVFGIFADYVLKPGTARIVRKAQSGIA